MDKDGQGWTKMDKDGGGDENWHDNVDANAGSGDKKCGGNDDDGGRGAPPVVASTIMGWFWWSWTGGYHYGAITIMVPTSDMVTILVVMVGTMVVTVGLLTSDMVARSSIPTSALLETLLTPSGQFKCSYWSQ